MGNTPVSIIILTYNEEANIRSCLESIKALTDDIFMVDSFSTDQTLEIAREFTVKIFQNDWTHYAGQRQWALANLPFKNDWILFLDADERLTGNLESEIAEVVGKEIKNPLMGGYYVPRTLIFLGRPIHWGSSKGGLKELRLCNRHHLTIGERAGQEVYQINGEVSSLRERMIHEDQKPLSAWIERHNVYSTLNAQYLWSLKKGGSYPLYSIKDTTDRKLYLKLFIRNKIWNRLPIGFRPIFFFIHDYFFRFGFLDGFTGFIYFFLHDFWYHLLIDAKLMEYKVRRR